MIIKIFLLKRRWQLVILLLCQYLFIQSCSFKSHTERERKICTSNKKRYYSAQHIVQLNIIVILIAALCIQNYKVTLLKTSCKMICVHHSPLLLHFSFLDCLLIYGRFWCTTQTQTFFESQSQAKMNPFVCESKYVLCMCVLWSVLWLAAPSP